jgi:hypothetical protein
VKRAVTASHATVRFIADARVSRRTAELMRHFMDYRGAVGPLERRDQRWTWEFTPNADESPTLPAWIALKFRVTIEGQEKAGRATA